MSLYEMFRLFMETQDKLYHSRAFGLAVAIMIGCILFVKSIQLLRVLVNDYRRK